MPTFTRLRLHNISALHIGLGRDSHDTSANDIPSDSLTAAIAAIRAMEGKGDDLEAFLSSFSLSSAFPYQDSEYFLPRPNGRLNITVAGKAEHESRKDLKKLQYISSDVWSQLASGQTVEVKPEQLHKQYLLGKGDTNFTPPMMKTTTTRVSVSRTMEDNAQPFQYQWTFFKNGKQESGLYCLLCAESEETEKEVFRLFQKLGQMGFGSGKSVGGGLFEIVNEKMTLPDIDGNATMLLSTYIPSLSETAALHLPRSNYQLVKRGGFMAGSEKEGWRHLRRKIVNMFNTGSVFSTITDLQGIVVELTPDWNDAAMHPVFRSGKPFIIKIKAEI